MPALIGIVLKTACGCSSSSCRCSSLSCSSTLLSFLSIHSCFFFFFFLFFSSAAFRYLFCLPHLLLAFSLLYLAARRLLPLLFLSLSLVSTYFENLPLKEWSADNVLICAREKGTLRH